MKIHAMKLDHQENLCWCVNMLPQAEISFILLVIICFFIVSKNTAGVAKMINPSYLFSLFPSMWLL